MSNLIEVTVTEFFAALNAKKIDIMPTITSQWSNEIGYISEWKATHTRELFGVSQSGNGAGKNKKFWLNK